MTDISIHDNIVTGYSVSCEKHRIVLHTEFRDRDPIERTDIVFYDVEAYCLFRDNMSNILNAVTELDLSEILEKYSAEFESGAKYAWPGFWNKSPQSCLEYLRNRQCKGWEILSSIGMEGFVIAKKMTLNII
jgi:hypothetical protein